MRFEWDIRKDLSNRAKHDVSFELAQLAFADPFKKDKRTRKSNSWMVRSGGSQSLDFLRVRFSSSSALSDGTVETTSSESFQREGQTDMNDEHMKRILDRHKDELAALDAMTDEDIDYSDIPPIRDWSGAVRGRLYRPVKEQITLRLDADVIAWFKQNEAKYQTAINAALREHVARRRRAS